LCKRGPQQLSLKCPNRLKQQTHSFLKSVHLHFFTDFMFGGLIYLPVSEIYEDTHKSIKIQSNQMQPYNTNSYIVIIDWMTHFIIKSISYLFYIYFLHYNPNTKKTYKYKLILQEVLIQFLYSLI